MAWNHRVIRRSIAPSTDPEWNYQIHEVYYDEDGSIENWTENLVAPLGECLLELQSEIKRFSEALNQSVLEVAELDGNETLVEVNDR